MTTRTLTIAVLLVLTVTVPAFGQQADTAVVVGVVADVTGAVIPGVDLRFSHTGTGSVYTVQTDPGGFYRTPPFASANT